MPVPDPELLARAGEAARDALGCEPVTSVRASTSGRVTVHARCADGPGVAIKVYRDPDKLRQELRHSRLARGLGLPVPHEVSFAVGPPAVLVTAWMVGEPIDGHSAAAQELGRLLATYYTSREPPSEATDGWADQVRVRVDTELSRAGAMALFSRTEHQQVAQRLGGLLAAVEHRPRMLIHGDLQPEHVLIEPRSLRVVAILDWADSGFADPLFEVARISLLTPQLEEPFLAGLGIETDPGLVRGYRVLWLVMSATWLAERGLVAQAAATVGNLRSQMGEGPGGSW